MLLVYPSFDYATKITSSWADQLVANKRLKGKLAIRNNFEEEVRHHNAVILYSHGDQKSITGNDRKPILDKDNAYLLEGKKVFGMACQTAKKLGKLVPSQRYLGFNDNFSFTIQNNDKFGRLVNDISITFAGNKIHSYHYIVYILRCGLHNVKECDTLTRLCMKKDVKAFRYIENDSGLKSSFNIIEGGYDY